MANLTPAHELTLREVKTRFGLTQVSQPDFFPEWQVSQAESPPLDEYDRRRLDQARTDFLYLAEEPVHEEIVKLVVLSPLLSVAGFYQHPFRPVAERQIELTLQDADEVLRGRLDLLVLNKTLWVTVLEAKSKRLNVLEAIPQALFYMMSSPGGQRVLFGLATNGSEFLLLKLQKGDAPQYALSQLFSLLNPENDLYRVAGILQHLADVVAQVDQVA
jgi:hypothetical protein